VLLVVSGVLLVGWLGWLGYAALTKSRAPTVSHVQAAVATVAVRAKLTTGNKDTRAERRGALGAAALPGVDGKPAFIVTVEEPLSANAPGAGAQIGVANLPGSTGFSGDGDYLLLLARDGENTIDGHPSYYLIGQQRSPGSELGDVGSPLIYRWDEKTGDDLRQQVKRLFP
jgi:hypothetical protein